MSIQLQLGNRLEALVDRAPTLSALRAHGLHLAAARIWRTRGTPVPADLDREARRAAVVAMATPVLLERVRHAYDGRLLLMKGPEAAAWYREPSDRFFRDLDLLADDPSAAQRALVAAGFMELGNPSRYETAQHLRPLIWPGVPLVLEIHRYPNCPAWLPCPDSHAILEQSVPSATGIAGLLAPHPSVHALLLTGHGWAHQPLGRLIDLLDVASVIAGGDRSYAEEVAQGWGWKGAWRTTISFADAILSETEPPAHLGVWGGHLRVARERTVLENHLARLAAPVCALPITRVPRAMASVVRSTATRSGDETWALKLQRSRLAAVHALMDKSSHERTLPQRRA